MKKLCLLSLSVLLLWSCQKEEETAGSDSPMLRIQYKFDAEQERLNNIGQVAPLPLGHAGQTPDFNALSAYYIELVPTKFTQLEDGLVAYRAKTQVAEAGGNFEEAVIFDQALVSDEGEVFLEIPLKDLVPGTYEYLRASVTYQNADVRFNLKNLPAPLPPELNNQLGTSDFELRISGLRGRLQKFSLSRLGKLLKSKPWLLRVGGSNTEPATSPATFLYFFSTSLPIHEFSNFCTHPKINHLGLCFALA